MMKEDHQSQYTKGALTTADTLKLSMMIIVIVVIVAGAVIGGSLFYYQYEIGRMFDNGAGKYALGVDIDSAVMQISQVSEQRIKALPRVYVIPRQQFAAPVPNPDNFSNNYSDYSDETITAHYYKEKYYGSLFHFIEVTIANPSQIRMALAKNTYGTEARDYPSKIAKSVNAVAAVDGCFYNNRPTGVLIYQGKLYRNRPCGLDVLLIDADGDLHIVKDTEIESSGVLKDYDIVNTVTFGPALVRDGEAQKITTWRWEPKTPEPRTAIAQLGRLHYLLCTVDGRQPHSEGVTTKQFAEVLAKKGCQIAYNLDGGQSCTLVMGNRVKNKVAYGGQRKLGDILYFGTALDE